MESKDKKIVLIVACISLSIVISSFVIKDGLIKYGDYVNGAGSQIASSINNLINSQRIQPPESDILDVSQAANFLHISNNQLVYLITNSKFKDGKGIPYFKVDNNIFFSRTALSQWVVTSSQNRYEY